ncbi:hypothetical protein FHW69_003663 [Luteibacter sp. Sphag1AF]|uniref:hypothetical protein n=1 Tax=Luteibacter sp. Sphag1AF TaxID=2587031 RepID=UPI0016207804|nr:hypothetical protein [Luteibacter sp. Sphag1AF]MBB3229015.1 hypothetical protein [Luteibacter sp. Sphag1AF]
MGDLLDKVMQGVDPADPAAFGIMFGRLMALVPWGALVAWSVFFIVVGALLGWWRGRLMTGVVWAIILGPFGWIMPFLPARRKPALPPPLPPAGPSKKR